MLPRGTIYIDMTAELKYCAPQASSFICTLSRSDHQHMWDLYSCTLERDNIQQLCNVHFHSVAKTAQDDVAGALQVNCAIKFTRNLLRNTHMARLHIVIRQENIILTPN